MGQVANGLQLMVIAPIPQFFQIVKNWQTKPPVNQLGPRGAYGKLLMGGVSTRRKLNAFIMAVILTKRIVPPQVGVVMILRQGFVTILHLKHVIGSLHLPPASHPIVVANGTLEVVSAIVLNVAV